MAPQGRRECRHSTRAAIRRTTMDRQSLNEAIQRAVPSITAEGADSITKALIDEYVEFDPSQLNEILHPTNDLIVFGKTELAGGAVSYKAANAQFNLAKLTAIGSGGVLGVL